MHIYHRTNDNSRRINGYGRGIDLNDTGISSADGTRAVTYRYNCVALWDVQKDRCIAVCNTSGFHHQRHPKKPWIVFALRCRKFLTNTANGDCDKMDPTRSILEVWDGDSGKRVVGSFKIALTYDFDVSPGGTHIACFESRAVGPSPIRLIDLSDQQTLPMPYHELPPSDHSYIRGSVKFTPDGDGVACSVGGNCDIWNIHDQTVITALTTNPNNIQSFAYSQDGWCLVTYRLSQSLSSPMGLQIWRFHVDNSCHSFTLHNGWALDSLSQPQFWIPKEIRLGFPDRAGVLIADDRAICGVDYGDMVVGNSWSECYIGN